MKVEDLLKLVEAIKTSDFDEFVLEAQDVKLTLRRASTGELVPAPAQRAAQSEPVPTLQPSTEQHHAENQQQEELIDVLAPMVGTFYQAPSPGADPFVKPGDTVKSGDTLCILEAMKLMNEIEAEVEGEVVEVAVNNGELVEYGQTLMMLRPFTP